MKDQKPTKSFSLLPRRLAEMEWGGGVGVVRVREEELGTEASLGEAQESCWVWWLDRACRQQELRGGNDEVGAEGREAGNYYFFLSFGERIP